eukprot:43547_1
MRMSTELPNEITDKQMVIHDATDLCPDHHYDLSILEWNKNVTSFGAKQNDIPIHSELLRVSTVANEYQEIDEKQMNTILQDNADFIIKFLSYIISHQCVRNDGSLFAVLEIQKRDNNEYVDDWKPYLKCIQKWIQQTLYETNTKDETPKCVKQFIIYQYAPKSDDIDKTDIHPFQLQNQLDTLVMNKDKETIQLLNTLQTQEYMFSCPNKVAELRRLLNKLQNITVNHHNTSKQFPLFVHHFYPAYTESSRTLANTLVENTFNLIIPNDVIWIIVEFAINNDNSMYYNSWYLKRNAINSANKLVKLCDNLLFNETYYTLTENNKFNGSIANIWIPSQYLLENKNNCLQNVVNEIRKNNILHIYRQITWSIFLHINSLSEIYNHDVKHIGNEEDWLTDANSGKYFYNALGWEEWNFVYLDGTLYDTMFFSMMHVFGGNVFNSIYAIQRMILVKEYDVSTAFIDDDYFKKKLDKRMKEIFPIIIPTIYQVIETFLNATDDPPLIFEIFEGAFLFDPLLKNYLLELMLLDGMDALVLTFAAYTRLTSAALIQIYTMYASNDSDDKELKRMTRQLYSFKDVKRISKLYVEYRTEIMEKHSHIIKLNSNPLMFPVDYRENPPEIDSDSD